MQQFADFALQIMLPPNPVRNLDNTGNAAATLGATVFSGANSDGVGNCNFCHTLDPALGFFGTGIS